MTDRRNYSSKTFQFRHEKYRTRTPAATYNRQLYPTINAQSLENAIEQVHALLDFSHRMDGEILYARNPIAIQALESLFVRILQYMQTVPSNPAHVVRTQKRRESKLVLTYDQLDKLHNLFWRVNDIPFVPTLRTVESLWLIYKQHWPTTTESSSRNETSHHERDQTLIQFSTHLLYQWIQWSSHSHSQHHQQHYSMNPLSGHPAPTLYFQQLLKALMLAGMPMTEDIWTLYNAYYASQWQQSQQHPTDTVLREVFRCMLEILSYSGKPWSALQCQVLQNMAVLRGNYKDMVNLTSTESELLYVVRESASVGRVNETAWICRQTNSSLVRSYFLPSLLNCKQPGSLLYMEKYVMSEALHQDFHTKTETIKMLLQKCSLDSDIPLAGRMAERIFRQLRNHTALRDWQPDFECMQYVVDAYLRTNRSTTQASWKHVLAADRFIRHCVQHFGVHTTSQNGTIAPCRVFENILQSYSQLCVGDEAPLVLKHSDEFFRFFLIHHQRGRITAEVPSEVHFFPMIHLWNRFSDSHAVAAEKVAEYSFLWNRLQQLEK
jgi:hypothetical protein